MLLLQKLNQPPLYTHSRPSRFFGGGRSSAVPGGENVVLELSDSESDEGSDATFVSADWIGTGKAWDSSLPKYVKNECSRARRIPLPIQAALFLAQSSPLVNSCYDARSTNRIKPVSRRSPSHSAMNPTGNKAHLLEDSSSEEEDIDDGNDNEDYV